MFKKKIPAQQLAEIQEINRIAAAERFKAQHVGLNTALVPRAKQYVKQCEAVAEVVENVLQNLVSQRLREAGLEAGKKANLNLATGEIIEVQ